MVFFVFLYELSGGIFLIFINILTFRRYLERKRTATLYLSLAIFSMMIAVLISSIGRLVAFLGNPFLQHYYGIQYVPFVWIPLALAVNIVGDMLFLLFSSAVFYNNNEKFNLISIISGAAILVLAIFLVPSPALNPVDHQPGVLYTILFYIFWSLCGVYSMGTGLLITYSALKMSRKDRPLLEKRGLQIISLFGIFLSLFNIMWVIEAFGRYPLIGGNFSPFFFIGWIFAHTGVFFIYLGFVLPNWLRKRWE